MNKALKIITVIFATIGIIMTALLLTILITQDNPQANEPFQSNAQNSMIASKPIKPVQDVPKQKEPLIVSGSGSQASKKIYLNKGLTIFRSEFKGEMNFIVYLLDEDGNQIGLIANEIGSGTSSKPLKIQQSGYYLFDILSDGNWRITIEN